MAFLIETENNGELLNISWPNRGPAVSSDFVHPFIAVDFDEDDQLVSMSVSGRPYIRGTLFAIAEWNGEHENLLLEHLAALSPE